MTSSAISEQIERLRQAIETLQGQRAILGEAVVADSVQALRKQIAELQASLEPAEQQRKVATVLFVDTVGSTSLVKDLDPEDSLAVMDGALALLAGVVERHGGQVVRFQGDGFKAAFGLPITSESDPENAVRAGLAMLIAAKEYADRLETDWSLTGFNIRVGIDTGLVIAGGALEDEDSVAGLPVNLAARLESAAPPGGLLISHHTYQYVRGVFDVEPQGPVHARGFAEPVPVYLVRREKPRAFRMGARGVEGIVTRTIGREEELELLQNAYRDAVSRRRTAVVTVVGDAGVGKSRLIYEFKSWLELQPESIWYMTGRASQRSQSLAQFLLRDMLAGRFQIRVSDPLPVVRESFVASVREFIPHDTERKAHILGSWLGYDFSDSPHVIPIQDNPEQIKNQATLYLAQFFTALSRQGPAVVLLDDVHWADDSSLDTVTDLVRRRPDLPLLVVCLGRPSLYQRRPAWGEGVPAHSLLDLSPLSAGATRALVAEILRLVDPLPDLLVDLVASRAEGNPFYAEELVKMLIDEGVILTGRDGWRIAPEQLVELRIPPTLVGVLQARLDMLRPATKRTAQQAAAIGRIFWDQALATLATEAPQELVTLQAREFIFHRDESAFEETSEYIFKHALLRDVIYETVLKRERGQYHALVAAWLENAAEANGRSEEFAALIGEHYELARDLERATNWYGRAGRHAATMHAHNEAVHFFSQALDFTAGHDDAARFALTEARERAYHMQGNRDAQREDLDKLVIMADQFDTTVQAEVALRQLEYAIKVSDFARVVERAPVAIELARHAGDIGLEARGHQQWGEGLYRQGKYAAAHDQFQMGVDLARTVSDIKHLAHCLLGLGNVANDMGEFAAATAHYEEALAAWHEIDDQSGQASSLNNLGTVAYYQGNYASAGAFYEKSLAIHREIGNRYAEGVILGNLGLVSAHQGDFSAATAFHEHSLAIRGEIDDRYGEGSSLSNLGAIAYLRGEFAAACKQLEQALAIQRDIGDRWGEGSNLTLLGAASLAQGGLQEAERYYLEALSLHHALNQMHYVAEDRAGLAQVRLAQGDAGAARELALQVVEYLRENPRLEGAEDPMAAFHFTWKVLTTVGQSAEANDVLANAAQIIQAYLDQNGEPAAQQMYLRQPHHSVLWAAWRGNARS